MLRRHPQAEIDLAAIWSFIAADDEDAATRILSAIDRKCRLIERHPMLGRPRPEIAPDARSTAAGAYLILYRSADDGVEIVRVLHMRRQTQWVK